MPLKSILPNLLESIGIYYHQGISGRRLTTTINTEITIIIIIINTWGPCWGRAWGSSITAIESLIYFDVTSPRQRSTKWINMVQFVNSICCLQVSVDFDDTDCSIWNWKGWTTGQLRSLRLLHWLRPWQKSGSASCSRGIWHANSDFLILWLVIFIIV